MIIDKMKTTVLDILLLASFVGVAVASVQVKVGSRDGDTLFVISGINNYAFAAPGLGQLGWSSVSINHDKVYAVKPNCETVSKSFDDLSRLEQSMIITLRDQHPVSRLLIEKVGPQSSGFVGSGNIKANSYTMVSPAEANQNVQASRRSFSRSGDGFIYMRTGLSDTVGLVASQNGATAFVGHDGLVHMEPSACLQPHEIELVSRARQEMETGSYDNGQTAPPQMGRPEDLPPIPSPSDLARMHANMDTVEPYQSSHEPEAQTDATPSDAQQLDGDLGHEKSSENEPEADNADLDNLVKHLMEKKKALLDELESLEVKKLGIEQRLSSATNLRDWRRKSREKKRARKERKLQARLFSRIGSED